jgi:ComF family protein
MAQFAENWLPKGLNALVMPVPLHPRRLRKRGFNQSLILARYLEKVSGLSLDYLSLRRVRDTPPQAALERDERQKNVKKAFAVKAPAAVKGRTILLVDDVSTTGSTLHACATALMGAGAEEVLCLLLARASVGNAGKRGTHGTLQGQDTAHGRP